MVDAHSNSTSDYSYIYILGVVFAKKWLQTAQMVYDSSSLAHSVYNQICQSTVILSCFLKTDLRTHPVYFRNYKKFSTSKFKWYLMGQGQF